MQHTKHAKLAIIASVLVAASLFGGLSLTPALAQVAVAAKQISQADGESTTVEAIELSARTATTRTQGTITVNILQNDTVVDSAEVDTDALTMDFGPVLAEFDDPVTLQGSFNVTAEYLGSGLVMVADMEVAEGTDDGTDIAEDEDTETDDDSSDEESDLELPEGIQIANVPRSQGDGEETVIEEITMDARAVTTRTSGDVIVAITQGDEVLATESIDAGSLEMDFQESSIAFDSVEVTGDFEIVVIFFGSGLVMVTDIAIAGDTTIGEDDDDGGSGDDDGSDDDDPVLPPGIVQLTVNAQDQNGTSISGLWVAVMDGFATTDSGFTEAKFNITEGDYSVMMDDFTDGTNTFTFMGWDDSVQGKLRTANLTENETFTALYTVSGPGITPPPGTSPPPTTNPPPTGGANTVTVHSQLLDGSTLTGMKAELRDFGGNNQEFGFTPATLTMEPGEDYRVVMYSFDNNYFRHWTDGGLHRYHSVNAEDSGQALTARYEHIDDSQKAQLRVVAITTDGQPIGGTTGTSEDGTLEAEAGVEVQIAPPGSLTPFTAYTAGFSGGSEIEEQFYFINGQTYVVMMQSFDKYQFSHWEDNGSTNSARAHTLSGDVTLTAVYDVVE